MASTILTVTSTEDLTPSLRRLWFRSDDLSAFVESRHTDRYVKLAFGDAVRTYTALYPDVRAGTLAIDFVLHGDSGIAGPWAARAVPGDQIEARGPGGAYRPDPSADWHLIVGDESAIPAVRAAIEALESDATARVFILIDDAAHEIAMELPTGGELTFVHRSAGADLVETVRAMHWLPGRVHAFVHGEAEETMHGLRPFLLKDKALAKDQVSISGYWRRGRTEEAFREWKSQLAAAEGATSAGRGRGRSSGAAASAATDVGTPGAA